MEPTRASTYTQLTEYPALSSGAQRSSWQGRSVSTTRQLFFKTLFNKIFSCFSIKKEIVEPFIELHEINSNNLGEQSNETSPLLPKEKDTPSTPLEKKPLPFSLSKVTTFTNSLKPSTKFVETQLLEKEGNIEVKLKPHIPLTKWDLVRANIFGYNSSCFHIRVFNLGPRQNITLHFRLRDPKWNQTDKNIKTIVISYLLPLIVYQLGEANVLRHKNLLNNSYLALIKRDPKSDKSLSINGKKARMPAHMLVFFNPQYGTRKIPARVPFCFPDCSPVKFYDNPLTEPELYRIKTYFVMHDKIQEPQGPRPSPMSLLVDKVLSRFNRYYAESDPYLQNPLPSINTTFPNLESTEISWGSKLIKDYSPCEDPKEIATSSSALEPLGDLKNDKKIALSGWSYKNKNGTPCFHIRRLGPSRNLTLHFLLNDTTNELQITPNDSSESKQIKRSKRSAIANKFLRPTISEHLKTDKIIELQKFLDNAHFNLIPFDKQDDGKDMLLIFHVYETSIPDVPQGVPFHITKEGKLETLSQNPLNLEQLYDTEMRYDIDSEGRFYLTHIPASKSV